MSGLTEQVGQDRWCWLESFLCEWRRAAAAAWPPLQKVGVHGGHDTANEWRYDGHSDV